jgi:dTDP-4-dehydrorhamnose 3,5-epimerase
MDISATTIPDVVMVETNRFSDHRGWFCRSFCVEELGSVLGQRQIVQINISRTEAKGAVRGFHFQYPPHAEMKFIRCLRGCIWDVALDLRQGSPTFLTWHAETLSEKNDRMLVIPEGCAHGFQVLEPGSELLYLHTGSYAPRLEGGVRYNDPVVKVNWPLPAADISQRDASHPLISEHFGGISL